MKCFEANKECQEQKRSQCFVYAAFDHNREEMEGVPCFILKAGCGSDCESESSGCKKCCFFQMRKNGFALHNGKNELLIVRCSGVLNNSIANDFKTLIKRMEGIKRKDVLLDITSASNIYSQAIGQIIRLHLECMRLGGKFVLAGASAHIQELLQSLKVDRIVTLVPTFEQAQEFIDGVVKKRDTVDDGASGQGVVCPGEKHKKVKCWEFFKNHNPKNATHCEDCAVKKSHLDKPCYIIERVIEGVAMEHINEDCCDCLYYQKYGAD